MFGHILLCAEEQSKVILLAGSVIVSHLIGKFLQPRCDEPWQEVVYADPTEGKVTVSHPLGSIAYSPTIVQEALSKSVSRNI